MSPGVRRRSQPIFKPRSRWPRRLAVAAAVAVVVALVALAGSSGDDRRAVSGADDVIHVHGLGVNPADGTVFLATHMGLFRLDTEGRPERVGDSYQDTMGFTVVGFDRFLASGHPDLRDRRLRVEGKPPLLGLVESRDGGARWEPRSLLGEADFHALAANDGRVYGWNASTWELMVTADMRIWERLSSIELTSFAIDSGDDRRLVAATGEGVVTSADGGRSWQPVAGAPGLVVVAWGDTGVWGVDRSGALHRSEDGLAWTERARLQGEPEALSVDGDDVYVALTEDGRRSVVRRSMDQGASWDVLYRSGG
jgi:hypothetical protein